MPTVYRPGKLQGFRDAINNVGGFALQQQVLEKQRQQKLEDEKRNRTTGIQDAVKKAIIESVLSRKMKPRAGSNIDINAMIGENGQVPNLNDLEPVADAQSIADTLRAQKLAQDVDKQRRLDVMAGFEAPSEADTSSVLGMPGNRLRNMGQSEGGIVAAPRGTTLNDGQILGSRGEVVGEYMPGYEPQELGAGDVDVAQMLRDKITPGMTQEKIAGQALGITMPKEEAAITKMKTVENTKKVMDNIKSKADLQELIDNRAEYEKEGVDVEKILRAMQGYLED